MTRIDWFNITLLTAVALAIRCYDLAGASLWLDEAATLTIASLPMSTLWISAYDPTPPLYYSVMKFVLGFGTGEVWMRFPSALFGALTVSVTYLVTRRLAGTIAAFTAALVLAVSFHQLEYGQEARAYALLGLCVAVSFLGLVRLGSHWRDPAEEFDVLSFLRKGGLLYTLGLLAALYTHNVAVFYWLGAQSFFLVMWIRPLRFTRASLLAWTGLNLVVFVLWLPWLAASIEIMDGEQFVWLEHLTAGAAFDIWRAVHGMPLLSALQPWLGVGLLCLALLGLFQLRTNPQVAMLLVALVLSSSVLMWAWGLVAQPVYMLRTLLWGSLFTAVLVGMGVSLFPRWVAVGLILAIALLGASSTREYFRGNHGQYADYRSAAAFLAENSKEGDVLLFRNSYVWPPLLYYIEESEADWQIFGWDCNREAARTGEVRRGSFDRLSVTWTPESVELDDIRPPTTNANLWIIHTQCNMRDRVKANAPLARHWRLVESKSFQRVELFRLVPK